KALSLQRATRNPAFENPNSAVPAIVHEVLRSSCQPLDAETRTFMEPHFGHDFSHVRVHTDARAAASTQAVDASAYNVGHQVVFDPGRHAPTTEAGKYLLAHELTHVVQQSAASARPGGAIRMGSPSDSFEHEASSVADRLTVAGSGKAPQLV